MMNKEIPIKCYIAAFQNPKIDNFLENNGFSKGVLSFAIPDYGIQFRCRADGELIELEFAAFFTLLKFLVGKLEDQKIKKVIVNSSNPEFIFSFTGKTKHLQPRSTYRQMLEEFARKININVGYIKPVDNKALISPADYPALPEGKKINISFDTNDLEKIDFKSFQKGIKL